MALFPNIGLQQFKFRIVHQGSFSFLIFFRFYYSRFFFSNFDADYWRNKAKQRAYFDTMAKKHGKDPLVPDTWYSIQVMNEKVPFYIHTFLIKKFLIKCIRKQRK